MSNIVERISSEEGVEKIQFSTRFVELKTGPNGVDPDEWIGLDIRVKWILGNIAEFRYYAVDGKHSVVTDLLGLWNPRIYHKDALAGDIRTSDMSRVDRKILREYIFHFRNTINRKAEPQGWRFGFDPHDSYEKHDPPWAREHFHVFVTPIKNV